MEICPVCKQPIDKCICCPEYGHVCLLDQGELYCPVCRPKPENLAKEISGDDSQIEKKDVPSEDSDS